MKVALDKGQFGPWALVTGASSGIGKEFTRQIAASGINVVLVARRDALLAELGRAISQEFDVQYRALAIDLSQEGFIAGLADATHDIDIGLVVSNAGTANPGEFLKLDRQLHRTTLRISTMAHLDITHHFARNSPTGTGAESFSRGQWVRKPACPIWQMTEPRRHMYTALARRFTMSSNLSVSTSLCWQPGLRTQRCSISSASIRRPCR